jgi:hypothetical protein
MSFAILWALAFLLIGETYLLARMIEHSLPKLSISNKQSFGLKQVRQI